MKKLLFILIAVVIGIPGLFSQDSLTVSKVHYWLDDVHTTAKVSSELEFDVDCKDLSPGYHVLHYRVGDSNGGFSALRPFGFIKVDYPAKATGIEHLQYWWDNRHPDALERAYTSETLVLATDSLKPGFHTLHYRVKDDQGQYSALMEHGFLKAASPATATEIDSLQYWWDSTDEKAHMSQYSDESFILSTDSLNIGLHSFNFRVKDNADNWSATNTKYFYKGESVDSARMVSYSYWWNDIKDKTVTRPLDVPATSLLIDEDLNVPYEARTSHAGHYTATLHIVLTDNHGRSIYTSANVEYPDTDAPVTDIDADKYVASTSVTLKWEEKSDDKMGDYNVYVSKDGGPFILWLPDTKQTSAVFKGEKGCNYIFTVTGRDVFGNREDYDEKKCVSVTFE